MAHVLVTAVICAALCSGPQTVKVWDGDTFRFGNETVRIENIDTPELKGACTKERLAAQKAKVRLAQLLAGQKVRLQRTKLDWYKRTLALVSIDGRDVGKTLIAEGHARPWVGKRMPWC